MTKIKNIKTVAILTITQYKRFNCLKILYMMIQKQTYKNINEWVIVEGSQNKEEADKNKINVKEFINEIKHNVNFKINYIEYTGLKLGGLRNIGNNSCTSDIIVCLDDDDYYPPERVENAVTTLLGSKCLIGGVSDVYLYDFFMDRLFKFKGFMEYHSTNNCMAYKKEYLLNHKHDPLIEVGEERSFTYEFTTPLVKLNSRKCIIAISHNFNTFNKRELCLGGVLKSLHTLTEIEEPITNYIDPEIYYKMKELYVIKENSNYDIAYMIGGFTNSFNPRDNKLYDNERYLVSMVEQWVRYGKSVIVYGNFENDIVINGVMYTNWKKFPYHHHFKMIIAYRNNGLLSLIPFPIDADQVYWDSYDNFISNDILVQLWNKFGNKVNKIFLKSEFHKIQFFTYLKQYPNQELIILPSGLRIDKFRINSDNVTRNPYRFCYTTYYDRGLEFIIKGIFSVIKKIEPRAELHVYTGMSMIGDDEFKNKMKLLFSENGVCDHCEQPVEIIAREKHLSSFELYISNIINEVDCTSIRESVIAGCIPLVANFGIFLEREGIRFDMNHEDFKLMQKIALHILQLIKDQEKLNFIRSELLNNSKSLYSVEQINIMIFNNFDFDS